MDSAVIWWPFLQSGSLTAEKTEDCFLRVWSQLEQMMDADDDSDDDEKSMADQAWRKENKGKILHL